MSDNVERIWDPLRKKAVALTPEEGVRQWFITVLRDHLAVPVHLMNSEVEMHYGSAGKTYRADIVIYGHDAKPLAIVECKRPEVKLTREVLEQALRYDMVLGVRWFIITNGKDTRVFRRGTEGIVPATQMPSFTDMCTEAGTDAKEG